MIAFAAPISSTQLQSQTLLVLLLGLRLRLWR
jgi:hypothetical protein